MTTALGFTDICPLASFPGLIALVTCDLQIQLTSLGTVLLQCLDAIITRTAYSFHFHTLSYHYDLQVMQCLPKLF